MACGAWRSVPCGLACRGLPWPAARGRPSAIPLRAATRWRNGGTAAWSFGDARQAGRPTGPGLGPPRPSLWWWTKGSRGLAVSHALARARLRCCAQRRVVWPARRGGDLPRPAPPEGPAPPDRDGLCRWQRVTRPLALSLIALSPTLSRSRDSAPSPQSAPTALIKSKVTARTVTRKRSRRSEWPRQRSYLDATRGKWGVTNSGRSDRPGVLALLAKTPHHRVLAASSTVLTAAKHGPSRPSQVLALAAPSER